MSAGSWIIGAIRTPVASENGELADYTAWQLGEIVSTALINRLRLDRFDIGMCVLGNALYGGGNPERVSGLAAHIPVPVPAITIDTQCCSGTDAITTAANLVKSGAHDVILAGGTESHSTAPRRLQRFRDGRPDAEYFQPPFSPWPDKDPNMLEAAAQLAFDMKITRSEQEEFAAKSHADAMRARKRLEGEFATNIPLRADGFTRQLKLKACSRLPVIAGDVAHGITAATTAVKADGAAVCAVVSDEFLIENPQYRNSALKIAGTSSVGCDPSMPALAPVAAVRKVLSSTGLSINQIGTFEIMEAFASQAIACIGKCGIDPKRVNLGGGALARGHPIGASGAINVVRLFYEMMENKDQKYGLATIAGAGGLGSAIVLSR